MPVFPKDIAKLRHDNEVTKIVDSFDRRLVDPKRDANDLTFRFHPGTSPAVITSVEREYRLAGWTTDVVKVKDEEYDKEYDTLILSERPTIATDDKHDPETLDHLASLRSWARRILRNEHCLVKCYSPAAHFVEASSGDPKITTGSAVHTPEPFTIVGRATAPGVNDEDDIKFVLPMLRAQAFRDMLAKETQAVLNAFLHTVEPSPPVMDPYWDDRDRKYPPQVNPVATVTSGDTALMDRDLIACNLSVSAQGIALMRSWGKEFFDEATQRDILLCGLYGHYLAADVRLCSAMPPHLFMHTTVFNSIGTFCVIKKPIMSDYHVLENGHICVECEEEIAAVVCNPEGVVITSIKPL